MTMKLRASRRKCSTFQRSRTRSLTVSFFPKKASKHEDEGVAEVGVTSCVSPQARAARAAAAASLSGSISSAVTVLPSVADSVKRRESREQVRKYDKEWAGVAEDPQPKRAKTSGCGRRVKPKRRGLRLRRPIARQSACVRTQRGTVNVPRYLKTDGTWMEPMRRREPPTLELDEHSIVHGYGGGGGDVTGARRSGMRSKLWYDKEKTYEGTIKKAHRKVKPWSETWEKNRFVEPSSPKPEGVGDLQCRLADRLAKAWQVHMRARRSC